MRSVALLFLASTLFAGDFTGTWIGQIPARNGEFLDVAFKLKQTGDKIEGKLYGDYKSSPIVEGGVEGDQVWFVILAPEQAGNQINETRLRFTGTMRSGEIEITRQREGATNAGNSGGVQFRGNSKTTFKLKRLL